MQWLRSGIREEAKRIILQCVLIQDLRDEICAQLAVIGNGSGRDILESR